MSHYYFERYAVDSHQVFGGLLPDLLKNVDKSYSFQLNKFGTQIEFQPKAKAITLGWKRHLEVDRVFHSADFFYHHTHELRKKIEPIVKDLPIRPSFMAHIGLELLLDHLLIEDQVVSVDRLYEHLDNIDKNLVASYFNVLGGIDKQRFFDFYTRFVESKYVFKYEKIENIPFALYNICKRLWKFETSKQHFEDLEVVLDNYKREYLDDYLDIYTIIHQKIN